MSAIEPTEEAFVASFLDDYYAECDEHLATIRRGLLALESAVGQGQPPDQGVVEEIFRGFHSLKGLSGMVGMTAAEQLAHRAESYLRLLRRKEVAMSADAFEAVIAATRLLEQVIAAARRGEPAPDLEEMLARLADLSAPPKAAAGPPPPPIATPTGPAPTAAIPPETPPLTPEESARLEAALAAGQRAWQITFTPAHVLAQRGININTVRSRLQALGKLIRATPLITPEGGISFSFLWVTDADPATFAPWAEDGIHYAPFEEVGPTVAAPPPPVLPAAEAPATVAAPAPPAAEAAAPAPGAVAPTMPAPEAAAAAPTPPTMTVSRPTAPAPPTIVVRVDLARLDDLMEMVGELVISRARLEDSLRQMEPVAATIPQWHVLQETNLAMERQLRDLREGVMRLRLVPIGEAFERMQFAVRDLARDSGKSVALTLSGQTTEIDKYVVERMLDPLMHLVRNAVSHGLETPAERTAAGKPPQGRLALRAATAGDAVVIEIEDDGRGMDVEKIAARARAAGLLAADASLDMAGLLEVICAPGFSTRDEADLASGRGMGMAVVRNTVQELGGTISLWTEPGRGTRFTIELPLTLAIVDALIVAAGGQTFAMPQPAVREVAEVTPAAITVMENNELIAHRGGVLPIVRLTRLFNLPERNNHAFNLLVIGAGLNAVGIAVDRILGQREIVVRAVSDPLVRVPGIAGATELGDGRVVLILDAQALLRLHRETAGRRRT